MKWRSVPFSEIEAAGRLDAGHFLREDKRKEKAMQPAESGIEVGQRVRRRSTHRVGWVVSANIVDIELVTVEWCDTGQLEDVVRRRLEAFPLPEEAR